MRGRREHRMLAAPASLACRKVCTLRTQATTGQPEQPAFPAQWVTAYTWSPRCAQLFGHRRLTFVTQDLIPASGDRDRTTSPSASAAFVSRSICGHRIPAPRISDDRPKRPSSSRRDAREGRCDLPDGASEKMCDRLARRADSGAGSPNAKRTNCIAETTNSVTEVASRT